MRRIVRLWNALSQYGFPFAIGRYATPVGRVRALARRSRGARLSALRRFALHGFMILAWPIGAFAGALNAQREMRRAGKPAGVAVFTNIYWLAIRHSIPPLEYGLYGFIDPARRALMHEYLYWIDLPVLAVLNRRRGADSRDVQDKNRFARICAAHGLPHVETLAITERGRQTFPAAPFVPETEWLWSKTLGLEGRAEGRRWHWQNGSMLDDTGRRLSLEEFGIEMAKHDTIVQPFVENHPAVARASNGGLAVLRVLTGMNEAGAAEPVATVLLLPNGHRMTTIGAVICGIAQGRVQKAGYLSGEVLQHHPDTGTAIVGLEVPFFEEGVALACLAHAEAFARFAFLGWDIALTENGPLLLETNPGWGAMIHQVFDGPLGMTAFSRLVSQYV